MTILELLLASAIIAIVIALIATVGGRMREGAQQIKCVSNLRQIGIAMNAYAGEHQQLYPPAYDATATPPILATWMIAIAPYAGYAENAMGSAPLPRAVGIFSCPCLPAAETNARRAGYFYSNNVINGNILLRRKRLSLAGNTFLVVEGNPANSEALAKDSFIAAPPQRHASKSANFLMTDGSVEALSPPFSSTEPRWNLTIQ